MRAVMAVALGAISGALVAAAPGSPRFTRLSVDDGLSQSSVQAILQDRKGLLWFGTQEGLNRYDGYRFTVHRARDQQGFLGDHDINALIGDATGNLWVGTSRGLYRHSLDTGRFDSCASPVDQLNILALVRGEDGQIFFAASDARLWVLDPAGAACRARPLNDGAFAPLTHITALARGRGSSIWAAARGGLFKVDLARTDPGAQLEHALADLGTVSAIATDSQGDVWIGRSDGEPLRYRPADGGVDRFPQAAANTLAILPGKDGGIWIGARRAGLSRLDPKTGDLVVYRHDPEDAASLSSDDVAAIYEDEVGGLWIGSWNGGVDRFDPHAQAFRTLRHRARIPDSLPADDVTAMTETPDGRLWLASRSGLIGAGDPRTARFGTAALLPGKGRLAALASWDGHVLVGTSRGLTVLETSSGREAALDPSLRAHHLGDRPITAIRSASGVAWIADGKELFRVTRDVARATVRVERLEIPIAGSVSALSTVGPGRIWIGSDLGEVVRAEWSGPDGEVTMLPLNAADPPARALFAAHGVVSVLHEDRHGRLWVGTRRGLGRIELSSGTVSWLGQHEGLPSTNIAGIAGEAGGHLWLAHNRGLTRMDPASGAMMHFGERDGAQGKGYAEGAWATGGSGLIYFAGEGVTAFDPKDVRVSAYKPGVVFTALEILHRVVAPRWLDPGSPLERTIDAQTEVTLAPGASVFSVEMAPLHYVDPPSNRLSYRLEGFDPEWIATDARNRVATYTNLTPGRYVLRARAGTKNGLWSERDATLTIHILPPWWRTRGALAGWFGLALGAAGLMWAAARRRARVRVALLERETLRQESLTDPLTGLHNRRFLITCLQQDVPKILRDYVIDPGAAAGADLLLLLMDVDYFKSINDRHSHGVGDRVLAQIANTLKQHIRDSDHAVRWGGDEFLVVTRGVQRGRAADSAERLRAAVEALGSRMAAEGGPVFTLSIGFAAFPFLPHDPNALSWEQTLELADHGLRLTKTRRNSYTGLRATPALSAASVLEFLAAGGGAPPPEGMEIVVPGEK